MKKLSLLFCLSIALLFGFSAYATVGVTISSGLATGTSCYGTPITFTATPSVAGSYGYIWNVNGIYVGASSATYTTSSLATGIDVVHCLLTNSAGDTILAESDTLNIVIDTLPYMSPVVGPTTPASVCIGDSIALTDASAGGVWVSSNPIAATVSATGHVNGVSLPVGGGFGGPSVRIYYILTNSCGSDTGRIRVGIAAPASQIIIPANTMCLDSAMTVADSAGGGQWTTSDSVVASLGFMFNPGMPPFEAVTAHTAGMVTISYSVTNACGTFNETANIHVVNCDSAAAVMNVLPNTNNCSVFPNPTTGAITVVANSAKYQEANCTITNTIGQTVKSFSVTTNKEQLVDLHLQAGVYFIVVSTPSEQYNTKITIID